MDDRGRFALPARLVPLMRRMAGAGEGEALEVAITVTLEMRIAIFPMPHFQKIMANLDNAPKDDALAAELRRHYLNYLDVQVTDKQNRVRVSGLLAAKYRLAGEVVVMGSGEYLEVVSKEDWEMHLEARAALFSEHRSSLGRFLAGKEAAAQSPAKEGGGEPLA